MLYISCIPSHIILIISISPLILHQLELVPKPYVSYGKDLVHLLLYYRSVPLCPLRKYAPPPPLYCQYKPSPHFRLDVVYKMGGGGAY